MVGLACFSPALESPGTTCNWPKRELYCLNRTHEENWAGGDLGYCTWWPKKIDC